MMNPNGPINMKGIQRKTARTLYGNSQVANPLYQQSLFDLFNQSINPRGVENALAPQLATIGDQQQRAEGQLDRGLAARGLSDSSAMASGLGALNATGAGLRSQAISGARTQEQMRQDALKQMAHSALGGAVGGMGGQAAGIANSYWQTQMQEDSMDGGLFGDIMAGLGTAAQAYGASQGMPTGGARKPTGGSAVNYRYNPYGPMVG